MEDILVPLMEDILVPLGICAAMPVLIVWLTMRSYTRRNENQKEVIIAALEKKPNIDTEQLARSFQPKEKPLKEKLLQKLLWGCIGTFLGTLGVILMIVMAIVVPHLSEELFVFISIIALPALALGVAFLINYFLGKKMLAGEIEAEERKRQQEL